MKFRIKIKLAVLATLVTALCVAASGSAHAGYYLGATNTETLETSSQGSWTGWEDCTNYTVGNSTAQVVSSFHLDRVGDADTYRFDKPKLGCRHIEDNGASSQSEVYTNTFYDAPGTGTGTTTFAFDDDSYSENPVAVGLSIISSRNKMQSFLIQEKSEIGGGLQSSWMQDGSCVAGDQIYYDYVSLSGYHYYDAILDDTHAENFIECDDGRVMTGMALKIINSATWPDLGKVNITGVAIHCTELLYSSTAHTRPTN